MFYKSQKYPKTPLPKRFKNPHIEDHYRTLKHFIKWFLGHYDEEGDKKRHVPEWFKPPFREEKIKEGEPIVTWINHSTFMIEINKKRILTDPIWSKRCSPLRLLGPKRKHMPPIELEDLEEVHYVIISHNHYDHLDRSSVKRLHKKWPGILWFVPLGVKSWLIKRNIYNVVELNWWEDYHIQEPDFEMRVVSTPAQHFSGRKLFDLDKTLWNGYVLEFQTGLFHKKRFYFAGDTGYNEHDFKKLGKEFGQIDLSLIPIGTYLPKKFQSPVHIGPKEALEIHKEVNSKLSIACHWNTFKLSYEDQLRPAYDLLEEMDKCDVTIQDFRILYPGQSLNW
jgi:N-acyl-phosphatidylethanolamine-hydrolysing phospholipase D